VYIWEPVGSLTILKEGSLPYVAAAPLRICRCQVGHQRGHEKDNQVLGAVMESMCLQLAVAFEFEIVELTCFTISCVQYVNILARSYNFLAFHASYGGGEGNIFSVCSDCVC
jgi:hypothetical protein